ncbi:MFS transporter [Glutamicibacter creatinolyticus]|uniref:MFS transporter n=1 Tax=Glutamicibacter creatinolyticus TaxID=162496 RepID=UPI003B980CB8
MTAAIRTQRAGSWWFPGICLVLTGWCANQYVSLIGWYQQHRELSEVAAFLVLASYVVGLLPMLVFAGSWADRLGRKPFTLLALIASIGGSVLLMLGAQAEVWLHAGRVLTGVGMGLAMVAATSWIKEVSPGASGAVRAGLCTSLGFAVGPVISGALVGATWNPELAYLVHAITAAAWLVLIAFQPGTPRPEPVQQAVQGTSAQGLKIFNRLVLPMAPWVFGLATSGFAVVPALTGRGAGASLLFSTITVAVTMGLGALIQPFARRWDRPGTARLLVIGLLTAITTYLVMIPVALTGSTVLGLVASVLAGCANGILLLGGLGQVLALAGPGEVGKLTGRFYSVCYIGFLIPTLLSLWRLFADPLYFILLLGVLCVLSLVCVLSNRTLLAGPKMQPVKSRS